jgi:hypothetical protein
VLAERRRFSPRRGALLLLAAGGRLRAKSIRALSAAFALATDGRDVVPDGSFREPPGAGRSRAT